MPAPIRRLRSPAYALIAILLSAVTLHAQNPGAASPPSTRLGVEGDVQKPLTLSLDDLRHLPRTTVKVTNEHDPTAEIYEGVLLSTLLDQAGVKQGAALRGSAMAAYVLAEGSDGYRTTFSIAEVDPGFQDSEIIVADTMNGMPLNDKVGPFRLVVPHDKRPARWVRMLKSVRVVNIPKQ